MKKITFLLVAVFTLQLQAQIVNIPDTNFKNALLAHVPAIDTNSDGEIQVSEANAFTGKLDLNSQSILDFTGLEAFTNITFLDTSFNDPTVLNLSNNTKIDTLWAGGMTSLVSLDLSKNVSLIDVKVRECFSLQTLTLGYQPNLVGLNAGETFLDYKLDLRRCPALESLDLNSVQGNLKTLDLSKNTNLKYLVIRVTAIQALDLSNNPNLTHVEVDYNQDLKVLNLKNGNTNSIVNLYATNMNTSSPTPSLNNICVDDVTFANSKTSTSGPWYKDNYINYTTACDTYVPDDNFEAVLISGGYDSGSPDDKVPSSNISSVTALDVSNKNITDLTGIEAFTSLQTLTCLGNNLSNLDLTSNLNLVTLIVSGNGLLTDIVLPNGANVINNKKLKSNRTNVVNSTLVSLDLNSNALSSLDLRNYSKLTTIKVNNNNLTYLNVQNGNNQNIASANFNAGGNSGLAEIIVDDVAYASTNWTNVDAGITFSTAGTLGVEEAILNSKIVVYPNPTQGLLNVQLSSEYTIENLSIYSVMGKQLKFYNSVQRVIDLHNLSKGVYFIRIKTDKGTLTKKIIKY
ncbi:MAG: T9SS type A sorting domain-containing protein [Flavobacteriaceae bacterium]